MEARQVKITKSQLRQMITEQLTEMLAFGGANLYKIKETIRELLPKSVDKAKLKMGNNYPYNSPLEGALLTQVPDLEGKAEILNQILQHVAQRYYWTEEEFENKDREIPDYKEIVITQTADAIKKLASGNLKDANQFFKSIRNVFQEKLRGR
jgi:soluble cytochrome b562